MLRLAKQLSGFECF